MILKPNVSPTDRSWTTAEISFTTVRPPAERPVPVAGEQVALGHGVTLEGHPSLSARARLSDVPQASRDAGNVSLPAMLRDHPDVFKPFEFTTSRGGDPGLSVLELVDVEDHDAVTPEQPLVVQIDRPLGDDEMLLTLGFDGEFYLPLGRTRRFDDHTEVVLERLPAPTSQGTRDLKGAIRIYFQKVARQGGRGEAVYALLVGIDRYAASDVPPLNNCVESIKGLGEFLRDRVGIPANRTSLLLDEAATRKNIVKGWRTQIEQAGEGDMLFFAFAGHGSRVDSSDPNSPSGFDSTLVAYDSRTPNIPDILDSEMAAFVQEATAKGAQVTLLLDCAYAGSETTSFAASDQCLILTACRESEVAWAPPPRRSAGGGLVTYILQESVLKSFHPGMTWADIRDRLIAELRTWSLPNQTPQLMGPANREIFGKLVAPLPPYLLVMELSDEGRVVVNASAALDLREGTRLAIYPPGSSMAAEPQTYARVVEVADTYVVAALETPETVELASRVRIAAYNDNGSLLRVSYEDTAGSFAASLELVQIVPSSAPDLDYRIRVQDGHATFTDSIGRTILRLPFDPSSTTDGQEKLSHVLVHLALYKRALHLRNTAPTARLAGEVQLELEDAPTTLTVTAGQPFVLRAYNRARDDLFVSVWLFTARFGIERVYPPRTDCHLVGSQRTLHLPIKLDLIQRGHQQEPIVFKVFATLHPHNMDVLQLANLDTLVSGIEFEAATPWLLQASVSIPEANGVASIGGDRITGDRVEVEKAVQSTTAAPLKPGAGLKAKVWKPGTTLRVRFLDGEPTVQSRVALVAQQWSQYANLRFVFTDDEDAEIRVSFQPGQGSWSHIGTDALAIPRDQPTMNLGWLTPSTPDAEILRIVLHEFGHVLGLIHEHQNPNADIPWEREKVYAYYQAPPNFWSREQVDAVIFASFDPSEMAIEKPFDPESIMLFPIPKELTRGGFEIGWNRELSALDKESAAKLYPFTR